MARINKDLNLLLRIYPSTDGSVKALVKANNVYRRRKLVLEGFQHNVFSSTIKAWKPGPDPGAMGVLGARAHLSSDNYKLKISFVQWNIQMSEFAFLGLHFSKDSHEDPRAPINRRAPTFDASECASLSYDNKGHERPHRKHYSPKSVHLSLRCRKLRLWASKPFSGDRCQPGTLRRRWLRPP